MVAAATLLKLGIRPETRTGLPQIVRWRRNGQRLEKIWQTIGKDESYPLEAAIRLQDHILAQYGLHGPKHGETQTLDQLITAVEEAHSVIGQWPGDIAIRRSVQVELQLVSKALARAINELKVEACEKLMAAKPLKDCRGRTNPSAVMARLLAVVDRLRERRDGQILAVIAPIVALRRQALELERQWMRREVFQPITRVVHLILNCRQWQARDLAPINKRLARLHDILKVQDVKFAPYVDWRDSIAKLLATASIRLAEGDQSLVSKLLGEAQSLSIAAAERLAASPEKVKSLPTAAR